VNKLQRQPYKINTKFLVYLVENWESLVNRGLLLPAILASINRREGIKRLRDHFLKNEEIKAYFDYKDLSNILEKNIQASNFELNIIEIAGALAGYKLYIPALLDFRGRNYRYGPFHYHERDLVRSLILFADSDDSPAHTRNTDTVQPDLDDIIYSS
jgi:DNA-directed RNA polymerase